MKGSWKTTAIGVVNFLSVLCIQLSAQLDGNDATTANWELVFSAAVVMAGFFMARDKNVSSEQEGLK